MKTIATSLLFMFIIIVAFSQPALAQNNKAAQQLYNEIYEMDSLMFNAFNQHDSILMMSYFSEDLEFFHDKGGLDNYDQTRKKTMLLFKNNANTGLYRTLVKGSMEVYPIPGYGAVETSSHTFCHKENGRDDCGTFKNIMIWKKVNNQWKVSRVISYDHK